MKSLKNKSNDDSNKSLKELANPHQTQKTKHKKKSKVSYAEETVQVNLVN